AGAKVAVNRAVRGELSCLPYHRFITSRRGPKGSGGKLDYSNVSGTCTAPIDPHGRHSATGSPPILVSKVAPCGSTARRCPSRHAGSASALLRSRTRGGSLRLLVRSRPRY